MIVATKITPYQQIGGQQAVLTLVEKFYINMDTFPQASGIRKMHAEKLDSAKQKLFKFLSGWLGGPDLFVQEFGHPRLKMRHFPFAIGPLERDQWVLCMQQALREIEMDATLRESLNQAFYDLASHMINRANN